MSNANEPIQPASNYISEVDPKDNPSCHVCGALFTRDGNRWKCLACGATTGVQPASAEEKRCSICGWPIDPEGKMCRPKDCSMRPKPGYLYDRTAAIKEYGTAYIEANWSAPSPSPSPTVGAAEWLAKRGSHNPLVYRELKTSYEYDSVASLLEDYSSDLRQQLAEAQQEIQLVKACNESQAAGVKAIWKILDPDGTYEGDLNLHDFLRQQLSSALRERDQAEAEVKTLVETHEKMNGALKAAESTSTKLREALQKIKDRFGPCICDYDERCPNCIAEAALTTPEAGKE